VGELVAKLQLREYQRRAVREVAEAYRSGARAILLAMPVGAGKTITGLRFALGAAEKGKRVVWLAHRRELVQQAAERLARDGVPHGVIYDGKRSTNPSAAIQVASVWTVAESDAELPADVLIWDEAHHAVASTFRKVSARYPEAFHLGLSATPERADRTALGDVFERLVAPIAMSELIAAGYLVPCEVIAPPRMQDELSMAPAEAVERFSNGRQTVIFAGNRAECEEITDALTERGITAGFIDGSMSVRKRERVLDDFAAKRIQVIVNVFILTEGWDVPETAVCILARKCQATATFLQMVGRALRPAPGKALALLVDLCGVVHQHGLPTDDRDYSLDGKAIKTKETRLALRQCPDCGGVDKPKPICGRCGFKFPPPKQRKVEEAELARVNVPPRAKLIREWEALVLTARSRTTRDGKPYSPKWAALRFKERFGFWPPRDFPRAHEVAT
jgi:superfamily II DNA or RNA helicase